MRIWRGYNTLWTYSDSLSPDPFYLGYMLEILLVFWDLCETSFGTERVPWKRLPLTSHPPLLPLSLYFSAGGKRENNGRKTCPLSVNQPKSGSNPTEFISNFVLICLIVFRFELEKLVGEIGDTRSKRFALSAGTPLSPFSLLCLSRNLLKLLTNDCLLLMDFLHITRIYLSFLIPVCFAIQIASN